MLKAVLLTIEVGGGAPALEPELSYISLSGQEAHFAYACCNLYLLYR